MAPTPRITPHAAFTTLPLVDISGLFSTSLAERSQAAVALGNAGRSASPMV